MAFSVKQRVQLHPATDCWMRGDRYGEISKIQGDLARVKLDKSGKTVTISLNLLTPI